MAGEPGTTDYIDADLNRPEDIIRLAPGAELASRSPYAPWASSGISETPENGDQRPIRGRPAQAGPVGRRSSPCTRQPWPSWRTTKPSGSTTKPAPRRITPPAAEQQVVMFFDGLEAVEPGIVPIQGWRPDEQSATLRPRRSMPGAVSRPSRGRPPTARRADGCGAGGHAAAGGTGFGTSRSLLAGRSQANWCDRLVVPSPVREVGGERGVDRGDSIELHR